VSLLALAESEYDHGRKAERCDSIGYAPRTVFIHLAGRSWEVSAPTEPTPPFLLHNAAMGLHSSRLRRIVEWGGASKFVRGSMHSSVRIKVPTRAPFREENFLDGYRAEETNRLAVSCEEMLLVGSCSR